MYKRSYHNFNFIGIWPEKTLFFEGRSWFNFNNLGLALGTNLKIYTSLSKGLTLKVRKFWGLISKFEKVTGDSPILNRVKSWVYNYHFDNLVKAKKIETKNILIYEEKFKNLAIHFTTYINKSKSIKMLSLHYDVM